MNKSFYGVNATALVVIQNDSANHKARRKYVFFSEHDQYNNTSTQLLKVNL